jgi:hypothetical protein
VLWRSVAVLLSGIFGIGVIGAYRSGSIAAGLLLVCREHCQP